MLVLLLAGLLQTVALSPVRPGDASMAALRAVESDSAQAIEQRWRRDRLTPENRLAVGFLALYTYRYESADSIFRSLAQGGDDQALTRWARLGLGLSAQARGNMGAADSLLGTAARIARARGDDETERETLVTWSAVQARRRATPGYAALLARLDSLLPNPTLDWRLRRRCLEGQIRSTLALNVDVAPLYHAADSADKAGYRRLAARCLFSAGGVLAVRGYADSGAAWLGRAARWQRETRDQSGLAATLQWLGYLQLTRGDYARAGLSLREGIEEGNRTGNMSPVSWAYLTLAKLSLALRDAGSTATYLATAESLFVSQGDDFGVAMLSEVQAVRALQLNDPVRARSSVERYHDNAIHGRGTNPAWSHRSLALLAMQEKHWDVAQAHVDSAIAAAADRKMAGLTISLLADNGRLALARGDAATAESLFRRTLMGTNPHQDVFRAATLIDLAEVEAVLARPAVAESLARRAVDDLEEYRSRLDDSALRMQVFDLDNGLDPTPGLPRVIASLVRAGRVDAAFELAERRRARKLLDRLVQASAIDDTIPSALRRVSTPTWPVITRALADLVTDSIAVVEFVRGGPDDPLVVFVATRAGLQATTIDSGSVLTATLQRYLDLLSSGAAGGALATDLGRLLLGPVVSRLPLATRRLVVVPDGELHRVPFDALRLSDGAPVVSRFAISLAPSVAVLAQLRNRSASTGSVDVLALGDPVVSSTPTPGRESPLRVAFAAMGGELPRLRATADEARLVTRLAERSELRLRGDASEALLKTIDLTRFRIVHIGAHAIVDDQTVARTGLALSAGGGEDGFVTPADLAALNLKADLVVLSGCRTAGGVIRGGEGLEGVALPMIEAGARAVLATSWSVRDRAAEAIVREFYRQVASGKRVGDALRAAKLDAISRGRPESEWAAFTLIGDAETAIPLVERGTPLGFPVALVVLVLIGTGALVYRARVSRRRVSERT